MAVEATTVRFPVINQARNLVFFYGTSSSTNDSIISYNYKTGQWTRLSAYVTPAVLGMFSINSRTQDIGLVRFSSGSVDLQEQTTDTATPQLVSMTPSFRELTPGRRSVLTGVRALGDGVLDIQFGWTDTIGGSETSSSPLTPNSRSGYANQRREARYHRFTVAYAVANDLSQVWGADIEFEQGGKV